jgi:hypothetical protein
VEVSEEDTCSWQQFREEYQYSMLPTGDSLLISSRGGRARRSCFEPGNMEENEI